jgi:hypothetical protein
MMPNAPSWPTQGQPTDDMKEYQFARSQGYSGPLEQWLRQSQDAKRSQTVINNQTPFENEYDKALGKAQAEEFLSIQDAPKKRYGVVQQMEQIHNLLGNRGGFAGSTLQELKMAAQRLGVDVTGLDADQAAQALSNDLALKLRTTGEGGGMPGAMSDPDRVFLQKQVPGIEFTPEGRQRLIEVHRRLLQRENDVALAARDYAAQHGRLDAGFYNNLAKFRDHPLFDDLQTAKPQPPASAPASGSRITNFRRIQ